MIVGGACLAAACLPGIASAQVPIFPPPPSDPTPPMGSSTPVLAAPGDSTAFGANPSRTGETTDDRVFGPLKVDWTRDFDGGVSEPLVIGGMLIVNSADQSGVHSKLTALRASDGKRLWQQLIDSDHAAPIAVADATIVAIDDDGTASAYRLADGVPLWRVDLADDEAGTFQTSGAGVVADAGLAYIFTAGAVSALSLSDGRVAWSVASPVNGRSGAPALDDSRVFVDSSCGDAAALSRADGSVIWSTNGEGTCQAGAPLAGGGGVFEDDGQILDPVSGARVGGLQMQPGALSGDLALVTGDPLTALDVGSGGVAWKSRKASFFDPRVVGPTTFGAITSQFGPSTLYGFETRTGKLLSISKAPEPEYNDGGSIAGSGLAVGAGPRFPQHPGHHQRDGTAAPTLPDWSRSTPSQSA